MIGVALNVLCVTAIVGLFFLYVQQARYMDYARLRISDTRRVEIHSSLGQCQLFVDQIKASPYDPVFSGFIAQTNKKMVHPIGDYAWWFNWSHVSGQYHYIAIPLWFLILLFSFKPMWSFVAWYRSRRRHIPGHTYCKHCGYDLHGTTTEKCPECGEAVHL